MKKLLAILLAVLLAFSCFTVAMVSAEAAPLVQSGSDFNNWSKYTHSKHQGTPYTINGDVATISADAKKVGLNSPVFELVPGKQYELSLALRVNPNSIAWIQSIGGNEYSFYPTIAFFEVDDQYNVGDALVNNEVHSGGSNDYSYSYEGAKVIRPDLVPTWQVQDLPPVERPGWSFVDWTGDTCFNKILPEGANTFEENFFKDVWKTITCTFTAIEDETGETAQKVSLGLGFSVGASAMVGIAFDVKDVVLKEKVCFHSGETVLKNAADAALGVDGYTGDLCCAECGQVLETGEVIPAITSVKTGDCIAVLNGTVLTISGNGAMENYGSSSMLPWGTNITEVIIEDGVTSIGDRAFYGCSSLTTITIPDSVTSIGNYAFRYCYSLKNVYITDIAAWCNISFSEFTSNPLREGENLYLNGELVTDLIIPNDVTTIKSYAFFGCNSLTSITIPDSVTSIGDRAFSGCSSLTTITIPDSVTSIGDWAFYFCTSLTSITIPDSVTSIGSRAFFGCDSLTSITIHDSVTSIGSDAFYNTGYYNNSNNWVNNVLYIGNHLIEAESSTTDSYVIKSGTVNIADYAFYKCSSLTSITIPNSVTSIGDYAFYYCSNLKTVYYRGSEEDKAKLSIGSYNSTLTGATWYYNSCIGDANGTGEVDMEDVSVLAKYLAGWKVDCNQAAFDVSGDGVVNLFDLVYLSQYLAGWDVTLH